MKKKKTYKKSVTKRKTPSHQSAIIRTALSCLGIGISVFLLCSCLSFDIGDWPSKFVYPHNETIQNWCGSIGAFCGYYLLYYIGPGIFITLIAAVFFLCAKIVQKPTDQPILRAIGLGLLTVAASMSFQFLWPDWRFDFPNGSGGVLGIGAAELLQSHFASVGTFILTMAIWVVGAVLLADSLIIMIVRGLGFAAGKTMGVAGPAWSAAKEHSKVLNEIWRELSARQKPLPTISVKPKPKKDKTPSFPIEAKDIPPKPKKSDTIPVKQTNSKKSKPPAASKSQDSFVQPSYEDYQLPPLDLLAEAEYGYAAVQEKVVKAKASALEQLLSEFNVNARVVAAETGPVVTMF